MAAALTIAVLLAISVTILRIASVAMRLTGLPENVARFQCLSALTGTGFTTSEYEMIVNYPVRRKILVSLMLVGNLGIVTVGATFVVAFVGTEADGTAALFQAIAFAGAMSVIVLMTANRSLDRAMCGLVDLVLRRTTALGRKRHHIIVQFDGGFSVAEHVVTAPDRIRLDDLPFNELALQILAVRRAKNREIVFSPEIHHLDSRDTLIVFGSDIGHRSLADVLAR